MNPNQIRTNGLGAMPVVAGGRLETKETLGLKPNKNGNAGARPCEVWVLLKNGLLFAVILSFCFLFVWGQPLLTVWMQKLA